MARKNKRSEREITYDEQIIDAAIEISRILRTAKVEAPLRPKVIGAIVLAMYEGDIPLTEDKSLTTVNALIIQAIENTNDMPESMKVALLDTLHLSGADFNRLAPFIGHIVNILRRLNIRAVIHTEVDFLGTFYEAFLRYGYDNNALGIVFTPRHITRMCVELTGASLQDRVIDIACGTGGFLVSAFDTMIRQARSEMAVTKVKNSFAGFDTNPTVWALAMLNMFFRGDGKSHILNADCFDQNIFGLVRGNYTRAFLNPPFSQENEPEHRFIDRAMETLEPGGMLAAVVKAGIFADDEHRAWREQFLQQHRLRAVISLPEDIFYPTSAPTSIVVAEAHSPLAKNDTVFLARVWLDGFEKLKGRRVEHGKNQIAEVIAAYHAFLADQPFVSSFATVIKAKQLSDGIEWSPQEWLPQPQNMTEQEIDQLDYEAMQRIFQAIVAMPDLADSVLQDFVASWSALPPLPTDTEGPLAQFFDVLNGKSAGEKNYIEGTYPYISSGDLNNSIIRMIDADSDEVFPAGGLTVTAFGLACIQPWPFAARGNGGSSVRVLMPRYNMSFRELLWFAAQINAQRWRIFYARMAIKGRLARLLVRTPPVRIADTGISIAQRAVLTQQTIEGLSRFE